MDMTFTHSESGPGCISPHGVYITSNSCLSSLPATPHVRLVQGAHHSLVPAPVTSLASRGLTAVPDNPPALTHLDSNFTRLPTFRHPNCGWDARPARAMPLDGSSACAAPRPRSSISGQENISPDSHNAQRSARLSITQGVGIGSNARFCSKALRHDHPQSSVSGPVVDIFFDVASWDPGEIFNSGEKEGSCLHGRHPWDDHGERTASCRGCWRSPGSPDLHRDTSTAPHARGNRRGSYSSRRRRFAPLPRSARSNLPQFSLKKSSRIHLLSCPGCARRSQRLIPRSSPLNHFLGPGNRAGNLYDKLTVNRQVPTHGAEHKTRNSDNGVLAAETPQAHVHLLIIPRAITRDASLASARSLWDPDRAKVALRAVVTGAKLLPVSFIPSRQRSRTR
ncbi:hypothetical protein BKA62DRAFT_709441 [Auriculariales sp. MPI-PUGE-AT-0066]|nr:hypothetical protein BKA62DRAFT_709441 [Auriculariales sp. MPI-PUGE-AT-0066]